jgi:hypothetical protein
LGEGVGGEGGFSFCIKSKLVFEYLEIVGSLFPLPADMPDLTDNGGASG